MPRLTILVRNLGTPGSIGLGFGYSIKVWVAWNDIVRKSQLGDGGPSSGLLLRN